MQSIVIEFRHHRRTAANSSIPLCLLGLAYAHTHELCCRGLALLGIVPPRDQGVAFGVISGAAFFRNVVGRNAQPEHGTFDPVAVPPNTSTESPSRSPSRPMSAGFMSR